jgi:uncharacterized protein (TIGR04255 family)
VIGLRFTSSDEKQVLQLRRDGFTFSRLAPYTDWEQVFAEATRLYRLYEGVARPQEVTRPAVRYINRMLFPEAEVGDFGPFLTVPPRFPSDGAVFLTGFFNRVQLQEPDSSIAATIIQTVQQTPPEPGTVPVILDIDVYEPRNFAPVPDVVLPRFAALRDAKNRYFFASITEKAAELFE